MALINVIIPAYNCGRFIGDALESVFRQSLAGVEPIVVDDGSTDDTRAVVERFGSRVRYLRQTNQGAGAARNLAVRNATAEYMAFMDADDLWEPDHLKVNHQVIEGDSRLGGVFSDFSIFGERGLLVARGNREMFPYFSRSGRDFRDVFPEHGVMTLPDGSEVPVYRGHVFDKLFLGNFILPTSMIVRREAFVRTGEFRVDLRTQQDYEFWLRFARVYPLGYVDAPLVRYRRHPQQLTDPSRMEHIYLGVHRIIDQYEEDFVRRGRRDQYDLRKAALSCELAKVYVGQGRTSEARGRLADTLRRAPGYWQAYVTLGLSLVPPAWLAWARARRPARH